LHALNSSTPIKSIDSTRAEDYRDRLWLAETARVKAEASEGRFRLLAEASALLLASLDAETTLASVPPLLVPAVADWCAIDLVDEDGGSSRHRRLGTAHSGALSPALLHELERGTWHDRSFVRGIVRVVDTRFLRRPQFEHLRGLGLRSLMRVPLKVHARVLGALTLVLGESERHFVQLDLAFAQELASRCAMGLEHSCLYRVAQQAVVARDEFLAATSHELRTPLSHVKGLVSSLRQTDVAFDTETRADFLAETEHEADRLAELVSNLLEWSRIASGGTAADRRELAPLDGLVSGGIDRVRGVLGDHQLQLEMRPELPPVRVETSQMERVVANLVENAAKYAPPTSRIRITGTLEGDEVVMRVEDEGLGIAPDDLDRVFEPYVRLTGGGWPAKPGTGLGLTVCRGIVEAHGGRIRAENRPDGGAAFVVSLPACSRSGPRSHG
jgi:signal transduction histidine kinase